MNILGIETSCDETAASVVQNGRFILSNTVSSSIKEHRKYGGIIPEIASRRQMELIHIVVEQALRKSGLSLKNIHAIAMTHNPGLIGSLLVGTAFARALGYAQRIRVINVNHIHAHLYANFLKKRTAKRQSINKQKRSPRLPAIGLVASGGHSSLFYLKDFRHQVLIGQTRDDAAGEAFDKVARILGLDYPGGPAIDRLAKKGGTSRIQFRCARFPGSLDFSFSGIKTAVAYFVQKNRNNKLSLADICFAFQNCVVESLVANSLQACQKKNVKILLVGGGVAANSLLRQRLTEECRLRKIHVFIPDLELCMDNAAMIAGLGFHFA